MTVPLRLLIVEDSEDDAELIVRELERGGYGVEFKRVDTPQDLACACDLEKWDLIVSDFSMPRFSGTDALKLVRARQIDAPFIFISGTIGEETAVEAMKNGAQDYLVKNNLKRLVPAVERELKDYAERLERKRLEKSVQQLQKFEAIGRLSGGIAHDFNNMIGAILGWAELGCEETEPPSKSHLRFEKIREQSQRAAKLTSQLLAFGRKQVLQPRNLNLNILIQEEMAFLGRVIEKNIEMKIAADSELRITRADPTQIQQVLMNLCLNARDAMPEGGTLIIETKNVEIDEEFRKDHPVAVPGSYVLLRVSDSGIGMDPNTLEHIFEPFFTTKEMGRGTGLGLATVYGIVKQHGGFIYVDSKPRTGSSFDVYLPAELGSHEPVEREEANQAVRGKGTILLAEDHEGLRESVQEILQALGYRVLPAGTGPEALEMYRKHAAMIDLIIMDVVMPGMGGLEVYLQIARNRKDVPVIFTSGYAPKSEALHALLDQGAQFVQKPYEYPHLSKIIHEMVNRKRHG